MREWKDTAAWATAKQLLTLRISAVQTFLSLKECALTRRALCLWSAAAVSLYVRVYVSVRVCERACV